MAKKPAANKATPCDDGGPELLPLEIRLRQKDTGTFTIRVCSANAAVQASLQAIPNGTPQSLMAASGQAIVSATLPSLPPGRYALFWSILTASTPWQTRADFVVGTTTRFLRRKADTGNNPVNMGFLLIEVVP